jgi:hypothetical protein
VFGTTTKSSAPTLNPRARALLEDADDVVLVEADADVLAEGIDVGKQGLRRRLPEHDDPTAALDLSKGEEAPFGQSGSSLASCQFAPVPITAIGLVRWLW